MRNLNWIAIVTMWVMLCMISFTTNIAAPFGNIWTTHYAWAGMIGNLMNFAAYLVMGIPAGSLLIRFGYKKSVMIALAVGAAGMGTQLLSGHFGENDPVVQIAGQTVFLNFFIYLLGALICGFSVCILNTSVTPMINLLGGGGSTGYQLIQAGGTLNSLVGTAAPICAGSLVGTLTKETGIADVAPLCLIAMVIFIMALCIVSFIDIKEPQGDLSKETFRYSAMHFRHFRLGAIAIFCYVGTEVGIPSELNAWISHLADDKGNIIQGSAVLAGSLAGSYWMMMMAGRFICTLISSKVTPRTQMNVACVVAILLLLIAQITEQYTFTYYSIPVPLPCLFLILCGLCTAVMWAAIFNLATAGLGKYTAKASGWFMTMVVGGGIMPMLQENVIRPHTGYLGSYILVIAMLSYILYYSIKGSRNQDTELLAQENA